MYCSICSICKTIYIISAFCCRFPSLFTTLKGSQHYRLPSLSQESVNVHDMMGSGCIYFFAKARSLHAIRDKAGCWGRWECCVAGARLNFRTFHSTSHLPKLLDCCPSASSIYCLLLPLSLPLPHARSCTHDVDKPVYSRTTVARPLRHPPQLSAGTPRANGVRHANGQGWTAPRLHPPRTSAAPPHPFRLRKQQQHPWHPWHPRP